MVHYMESLTFTFLVIHTQGHTHTSTHMYIPYSVIPVRALNYLCHDHGECCQASHSSEYIWLHYPTTHGGAPSRWCAPTGLPEIWFHQMKVSEPTVSMDAAIRVHRLHDYLNPLLSSVHCSWWWWGGSKYLYSGRRHRQNSPCSWTINDCAEKFKLRGQNAPHCMSEPF